MATTATEHVPQHMRALEKATAYRLARAHVMADLENGDITLAEAIANPATSTMTVLAVVERLPFPGAARRRKKVEVGAGRTARKCTNAAEKMLERAGVSPWREVGKLTARECAAVIVEWEATCASASR